MGISQPTPIQSASVPTALLGKDICACAVTGSGKTLSFMLPTLERLLYKPKIPQRTRVLVLTPTRELAAQICKVTRDLAQFTSINVCLCAGGFDLRTQEAALRLSPDIVIATPGRLIDHLHNTPCFNLDTVEVFHTFNSRFNILCRRILIYQPLTVEFDKMAFSLSSSSSLNI